MYARNRSVYAATPVNFSMSTLAMSHRLHGTSFVRQQHDALGGVIVKW